MLDIFAYAVIYLLTSIISYWSVQSFFNNIELEDSLKISFITKIKLSLIVTAMYLTPLLFVKPVGLEALLLYLLTIPLSIIAIRKIPKNSMTLKSAALVFVGILGKFFVVIIILGLIARLTIKLVKG